MIAADLAPNRIADTHQFYGLLGRIAERTGGCRTLATCDGRMTWPRRGVYFFFEDGEYRSEPMSDLRVVRVGTHALKPASGTSLWQRLSQHRGSSLSGAGNHRGSIFRPIVGAALARRGDTPLPQNWGVGSDAGAAARKLNMDRKTVKREEASLERCVSEYIGHMPFLWLSVDDPPGPTSLRGVIERHAIALLSHASGAGSRYPVQPLVGCVQRSRTGSRLRIVEQPSRRRISRFFVSRRNEYAGNPMA